MDSHFFHFSGARRNARIQHIFQRYGIAAYGVYFFLLECSSEKPDGRLQRDYKFWASVCEVSIPLVKFVIEDSYLFDLEADSFRPISISECVEF